MVLLPKPVDSAKEAQQVARNVFFENDAMDYMAKHFVGNNYR